MTFTAKRQNVKLYLVTKFIISTNTKQSHASSIYKNYFVSFTCLSLRHFQLESRVCLLPFAVNFTLNLSNVFNFSWDDCNTQEK